MSLESRDNLSEQNEDDLSESRMRSSIDRVKSSNVFANSYLEKAVFVSFSGTDGSGSEGRFSTNVSRDMTSKSFEQGLRTDYIGLVSPSEYENFDTQDGSQFSDHQFVQTLFYDRNFPYDEFVAHETAHNVFDIAYHRTNGELETYDIRDSDGMIIETETDCSPEYLQKMSNKIRQLLRDHNINLDIQRFQLNRQKIAEIFALAIQREYARKSNSAYIQSHNDLQRRVEDILANIDTIMTHLNKESGRNVTVDDFYSENHVLSFIIVPLLESKYPHLYDRLEFFELDIRDMISNEVK